MRPAMGMGAAMMVVWGLVYAFPVFVLPMSAELHADRAALAGIVVAILFWAAVIGPPLGALVDRTGPRPALVVGIGLSSVGFALFGQVQELWQAYVAFAGILGTGQALVYLGANVLIGRHFAGERATAYGIAYAGLGLGTGMYAIVAQVLVDELGWRMATLALAATPILILPGVLRLHPREAAPGDEPAGEPAAAAALSDAAVPDAAVGAGTIGVFVLVFLSSVALGLVDEGIYQNLLPHAVSVGFGATVAAVALGVVSFAYVGGQLIGGPLVDRWGAARGTLVGFFIGIIPGGGAVISSLVSYAVEKRVSKHPEKFGQGAIEGVAGPEAANNAASSSSFIPLLTLFRPFGFTQGYLAIWLVHTAFALGGRGAPLEAQP